MSLGFSWLCSCFFFSSSRYLAHLSTARAAEGFCELDHWLCWLVSPVLL